MNVNQVTRLANPRDYLALLARRKWLILCIFVMSMGVALLIAKIMPATYVSESLILCQPREISADLVKEIENGSTDTRLTAIQETLLSRSNLLGIINEFQGKTSPYRGLSDEKKVDRMRDHLLIEFVTDKTRTSGDQPITNVRITYREQDPQLAQKIASRVTSLLIAKESKEREDQVFGTAAFLKAELGRILDQVRASSENLKELKEQYHQELPTQLEANLRALDRLQQQKSANIEALDRQTTLQLNLERQLAETPPTQRIGMDKTTGELDPLLEAYLKKEQEYKDLVARATDKHPDVRRLKAELALLRKALPPGEIESYSSTATGDQIKRTPNPLYQNLVAQLNEVKTEIEIRKREKRSIDNQVALLTRQVQNAPQVEQIVMSAERSHTELLKQAEDLREKLEEARLSESVMRKQKGAQFIIIDKANLPSEPDSPNRPMIFLYGTIMSMAFAIVAGFAVDLSRRRVFTSAEVERLLDTPILVEIPRIASDVDRKRARTLKMRYVALFLIGAGAYFSVLYFLFLHRSHLLRILEPFIE